MTSVFFSPGPWVQARVAICVTLLSFFLLQPAIADTQASLRLFPYPFGHSISFASDVDMQMPSHGAGIHRVFNEELGLTISDSLWPHGGNIRSSSLFLGPDEVNRLPSGVEGIPTFALLLREWHRGNIDHFHGWQDDSAIPLRNVFSDPQTLSQLKTTITLPPVTAPILSQRIQNLRLYFSSRPPSDLQVVLHESSGRSTSFPIGDAEGTVQAGDGSTGWVKEIIVPIAETSAGRPMVNLLLINSIDLIAPSCGGGGCSAKLTRVDRDHFSRRTVLSQLPMLEAWNVRPALLTSHGGNSLAQDFGSGREVLDLPRTPGSIYADQALVARLEALADVKTSYAYHADLLKGLGLVGVWSYFHHQPDRVFVPLDNPSGRSNLRLSNTYDRLYDVARSKPRIIDLSSREKFAQDAAKIYPKLSTEERNSLYCGPTCNVSQGDALPQLIAQTIQVANNETTIGRGLFYTHFGSGSGVPIVTKTYGKPITDETYSAMKKFSNYVHNFDGTVPLKKRIWSPPANTWLRYEILQAGIAPNIKTSEDGNTITITPWVDPVTKRVVPDLKAGTRDLHGLTVYVKNPAQTRVFVGAREIGAFVRNPPDQTGQASITVVDDNTPTGIIDGVALARKGMVAVDSGEFVDVVGNGDNPSFVRLIADPEGRARIVFKPQRLDLWNTTHLLLESRKQSSLNSTSSGRLTIVLKTSNGDSVMLTEEDQVFESMQNSSHWLVPKGPTSNSWRSNVLDVAQLIFSQVPGQQNKDRPALPIGNIQEIDIQFVGAAPGDILDISKLLALRPSGNGEAPDGSKLVAGRVTTDGTLPVSHALVVASDNDGKETATATDRDGYYFFYSQPRGTTLKIVATNQNNACPPRQGLEIQVLKNEFELDIVCPPPPLSQPSLQKG